MRGAYKAAGALELSLAAAPGSNPPLSGAGFASQRQKAGAVKRMVAQLFLLDVVPDIVLRPEGDGVYLRDFAPLDDSGISSVFSFIPAQAGQPGIVVVDDRFDRRYLHFAALVLIIPDEGIAILRVNAPARLFGRAHPAEIDPGFEHELFRKGEGLRKFIAGVDPDKEKVWLDLDGEV